MQVEPPGSRGQRTVFIVYPLPYPLQMGDSDLPARGPPASFSVHLASSAVTPAGSVVGAVEEMMMCVCVCDRESGTKGA